MTTVLSTSKGLREILLITHVQHLESGMCSGPCAQTLENAIGFGSMRSEAQAELELAIGGRDCAGARRELSWHLL